MKTHTVGRAEDLEQLLAREYPGVLVSDVVDHPDNKALFVIRTAQVLREGDKLEIPDPPEVPVTECQTGSTHKFRYTPRLRPLAIKIIDKEGAPQAGEAFEVEHAGEIKSGSTDGDGFVRVDIPLTWSSVELRVAGRVRKLRVGALEPVMTLRGLQARLRNLGFRPGPGDGRFGVRTSRAVKRFQAQNGLPATGHADKATRDKVVEQHGS